MDSHSTEEMRDRVEVAKRELCNYQNKWRISHFGEKKLPKIQSPKIYR